MSSIINTPSKKPKKQKQAQKVFNSRPIDDLQETILKNLADCSMANYHRPERSSDGQDKENVEQFIDHYSKGHTLSDGAGNVDDFKLPIDRNTLRTLSRRFRTDFNCGSLKFDEDTMPTFLIDEWAQNKDVQRDIFKSFLSSIGFTPASSSSTNGHQWNNKPKKKEYLQNELRGNLSYIMAEEMAIKESLVNQKHRLKEETHSFNLSALKDEYKNHGPTLIEELYIKNDFDYEMTRACLATTIIDSHDYHLQTSAGPKDYYDWTNCWPVFRGEDLNENPLDIIGASHVGSCSLKEFSDLEIAVKNSIADFQDRRCNLASNLTLDRLHERFPHISPGHLKLLYFKFNLNEKSVIDWLTKHNIERKQIPMTKRLEKTSSREDVLAKASARNITLKPTKEEISAIEGAILETRSRLNQLQDTRGSVLRSKQRINASDYYEDEIGSCKEKLVILQEQHAFAITAFRSLANSDQKDFRACWSEIDLHGLTWPNSLKVLKSRLTQLRASNTHGHLHVVTGRGINSPSGQGIIKKRLVEYLENKGEKYSFHESNPGVVLIKV